MERSKPEESSDEAEEREFLAEISAEFARIITERLPNLPPSAAVELPRELLHAIEAELYPYGRELAARHEVQEEIVSTIVHLAFGHAIVFGKPIDEAVRGSKRRREIVRKAEIACAEHYRFLRDLTADPIGYQITDAIERKTERIVRTRRAATGGVLALCAAAVSILWVVVALTPLPWVVGAWGTVGMVVGSWWAWITVNRSI